MRHPEVSAEEGIQGAVKTLTEGIKNLEWGEPAFKDPRYKTFPISEENVKLIEGEPSDARMAFVDGGNAELIRAPTFSVHLVRLYFNIFHRGEKVAPKEVPQRVEFYLAVRALAGESGEIIYSGKAFPVKKVHVYLMPDGKDLTLDSWDRSIMSGSFRGSITRIGEAARKFAEWKFAAEVASEELEKGDIIVRDGSLQTGVTNESKYANATYEAAEGSKVLLTGLAKSSSLYTSTGNALSRAIMEAGEKAQPDKSWYYRPVAEITHPDHRAELLFVKLNPESKYAFRYEIYREQAKEMTEEERCMLLSALASNSRDISFPGYPYGLIDADGFARISFREAEYHRALLISEASRTGMFKELQGHIRASDAHEILDSLRC